MKRSMRKTRAKVLDRGEMLVAFENSKSISGACRYLGVSYLTLRKYARMFAPEEFERQANMAGRGIRKVVRNRDIRRALRGEYNGIKLNPYWMRDRLIKELLIEESCDICGFREKRVTDNRVPLLLDWRNGDKVDWRLENLRVLCYNCVFLNVGNVGGGMPKRNREYLYDPMTGDVVDMLDMGRVDIGVLEDNVQENLEVDRSS